MVLILECAIKLNKANRLKFKSWVNLKRVLRKQGRAMYGCILNCRGFVGHKPGRSAVGGIPPPTISQALRQFKKYLHVLKCLKISLEFVKFQSTLKNWTTFIKNYN